MDRVDQKGKIFTQRVRKNSVEVEIVTVAGRIRGHIHPAPTQRVKDLLNTSDELFLAVTEATLTDVGGAETKQAEFVALNKQHIISVVPISEDRPSAVADGYYPY